MVTTMVHKGLDTARRPNWLAVLPHLATPCETETSTFDTGERKYRPGVET